MFYIENNDISITKGDWGMLDIKLKNKDGSDYIVRSDDKVIFSLKRKRESYYPVIMEKSGTQITFESDEIGKIPTGEYVYDVFLFRKGGEICTVVEGNFNVRKAAHRI